MVPEVPSEISTGFIAPIRFITEKTTIAIKQTAIAISIGQVGPLIFHRW